MKIDYQKLLADKNEIKEKVSQQNTNIEFLNQ
jgi:hypothetical protein